MPAAWSLSGALALSMFGSNWQALGFPRSVAPDRLVLGFTLVAIAARAPCARDRRPIRFRPLYAVMYAAGAYAIGSAIAYGTITNHGALFDLLDRMQILQWIVFIVAPSVLTTAADRRVLLVTFVAMGIYLGFTSIFEILGPHSLVFPRYIDNPRVGIHFGRARGPFVQAAVNGLALYACILGSLIAAGQWRRPLAKSAAIVSVVVCVPALLLTFQRTIWIGVGIAVTLTMLAAPRLRRYLIPAVVAVGAMVALAFATIPTVRDRARTREGDIETVRDREALNDASLKMVEARPLWGFGWGRFGTVVPYYFQTSDSYNTRTAADSPVHDVYFSIATELGLVGLALWLLILLAGVGGAVLERGPPGLLPWRLGLGSLFVLWLAAGTASPLAASFQSLVLWLWAAVVIGGRTG